MSPDPFPPWLDALAAIGSVIGLVVELRRTPSRLKPLWLSLFAICAVAFSAYAIFNRLGVLHR